MPFQLQANFFLKIGTLRAKDIRKNVPVLQVRGSAPAPPTSPIIRVVLPHTERTVQRLYFIHHKQT